MMLRAFWIAYTMAALFFIPRAFADDAPPAKLKLRDTSATSSADNKKEFTDPTTGMKFVFVKGGCYQMGSEMNIKNLVHARPVHEVCVNDFFMAKYEVTQSQYEKVLGTNPSKFKACGPDCPVDSVSWNAAQQYITKLNSLGGTSYRLPTEAEWEYAARSGGKNQTWPGTSDSDSLFKYGWDSENTDKSTRRVGLKKANGLGIHDMLGNVSEWCQDWFSDSYYDDSPKENPTGPEIGEYRVYRGGCYIIPAILAPSAQRWGNILPNQAQPTSGFRIVYSAK